MRHQELATRWQYLDLGVGLVAFCGKKIGLRVLYTCIKHANLFFRDSNCLKRVNSSRNALKLEGLDTRCPYLDVGVVFSNFRLHSVAKK